MAKKKAPAKKPVKRRKKGMIGGVNEEHYRKINKDINEISRSLQMLEDAMRNNKKMHPMIKQAHRDQIRIKKKQLSSLMKDLRKL